MWTEGTLSSELGLTCCSTCAREGSPCMMACSLSRFLLAFSASSFLNASSSCSEQQVGRLTSKSLHATASSA